LKKIRTLSGWPGLIQAEMENSGLNFYPLDPVRTLGTNRKVPVKVDDLATLRVAGLDRPELTPVEREYLSGK